MDLNRISYYQQGDYLLPELTAGDEQPSYGKYGMLRKTYMKNHKPGMYASLMLSGQLNVHLAETDAQARTMLDDLVRQYLESHPAPDKATQQMEWAGYMNNVRHSMEEIVMSEYINRD